MNISPKEHKLHIAMVSLSQQAESFLSHSLVWLVSSLPVPCEDRHMEDIQ
jgi:hypothetical protein